MESRRKFLFEKQIYRRLVSVRYYRHVAFYLNLVKIRNLVSKVFRLKSVTWSSFAGLFHSFPAAYLNVDWPIADFVFGKWISLPSLRVLPRSSDLNVLPRVCISTSAG